jgi:hypothetical protein
MARAPRKLDMPWRLVLSPISSRWGMSPRVRCVWPPPLIPPHKGEGDDGTDNVVRQTQKLDRTGLPTNMLVEPGKPSN